MEWILVLLLIPSVYFSARFFLLSRSIDKASRDFRYISINTDTNSKLRLGYPDKNLEELLTEVNKYLEDTKKYKIKYQKREENIRREIENISHDLRTPLTSIRGYLELINDNDITEDEKRNYIHIVEKRSKVLQSLIQDFYDLSRFENNDYKLNMEIIDINKELREQILIYYNDFEKRNIDVNLKLGDSQVLVNLDKGAIKRVFDNLIQNSIKYSKSRFCVSAIYDEKKTIIEFKNDFNGINKEEISLLFNRFYRGDSSRNSDSSGLGLTIAKLLVESMNGEINTNIDGEWIIFSIIFKV